VIDERVDLATPVAAGILLPQLLRFELLCEIDVVVANDNAV
jgi:hypothetical protein